LRRVRIKSNLLQSPLNFIFGQGEVAVRILRLLSRFEGESLSMSEISSRTELSLAGARRALESLETIGIIERAKSGKKSYSIRLSHPFTASIICLFKEEAKAYENIKQQIKEAFKDLQGVSSAWLNSAYYEAGKPLQISFIAPLDKLASIKHELSEKLYELEKSLDISIRYNAIAREDADSYVEDVNSSIELINGMAPSAFNLQKKIKKAPRTHAEQNSRSLNMAKAASEALSKNPTLILDVSQKLDEQIGTASASTKRELMKWKRLIDSGSIRRIRDALTEESAEADRMRQSSPFHLILKDK